MMYFYELFMPFVNYISCMEAIIMWITILLHHYNLLGSLSTDLKIINWARIYDVHNDKWWNCVWCLNNDNDQDDDVQVHQRLKEQLSSFQKSSDEAHDNIRQNIKDIENELDKNRREHEQFNQDINANKVNYMYLHILYINKIKLKHKRMWY